MAFLLSARNAELLLERAKYIISSFQQTVRKKHANRNILTLADRGMYEDIFPENSSNEILELLKTGTRCVYAGFDPTANSLHIGNLLVLTSLLHWQRAGHQVIAVVGGSTARIGDPSGRTRDREEQNVDIVLHQCKLIADDIRKVFDNHRKYIWGREKDNDDLPPVNILNNENWYKDYNVIDFVSTVGRHFRMGKMLLKDSVSKRLDSERGMSFTEFTYQMFQAYDWLHLYRKYQCLFQIGGKDQMGNIVSGHNLIGRVENGRVYGFTLPLITTDSGEKLGKSAGNAVWLNESLTSPFELYQYFIRTEDRDVEQMLKLFTFESLGTITTLMEQHYQNPEKRIPQNKLAKEVTLLVHGENGLKSAQRATSVLYSNDISALSQMSSSEISRIFEGASITELSLQPGFTVLDLALNANCFVNESDARRIIEAGGFYINYERVTNVDEILVHTVHVLPNNVSLIRVGKRNYSVVKWR